jgi:hypothetical protein
VTVFVTNANDFDHEDSYNGQRYVFPKGQKVPLDDEAAAHMFGYRQIDKTENLLRLGWANLPDDGGVKRLRKFIFAAAKVVAEDDSEEIKSLTVDMPVMKDESRVQASRAVK